ncbi:MAG: hypothetical protein EOP77_02690 [Variovorax sp.]|nr:MAG: hypothetical protein EOP77_02690 [Variovorax sp.]
MTYHAPVCDRVGGRIASLRDSLFHERHARGRGRRHRGPPRMQRLAAATLLLLLTLALPACGQSMKKQPDVHLNPNPKLRYGVTLTIDQAPGPFESVIGYANFETGTDCVPEAPITAANYGSKYPLDHSVPVQLQPAGANTYQGTIFMDWPEDEDYFGLGICRWQFTTFSAVMKVGEVSFSTNLWGKDVVANRLLTEYFARGHYGKNSIRDFHVPGSRLDQFAPGFRENVFSTTLIAKERFE